MGIYIFLIILIISLDVVCKKKKVPPAFWLLMAILTFISAVRYNVGTDYMFDISRFSSVNAGNEDVYELGYAKLIYIIAALGGNVYILFMVTSVIINAAFAYTIVKNVDIQYRIFAVFIYFCSTIFFNTMTATRQYTAIAILMLSFEILKKRKYFIATILVLISSLFHTSTVFVLLFCLLIFLDDRKNIDMVFFMNIFVAISIVFMFVDIRPYFMNLLNFIPERYLQYLTEDSLRESLFEQRNLSAILKCIVPNILWFLSYFNRKKIMKQNVHFDFYMIGFSIYLIISNAFYGVNVFFRVYILFEYFIIYLIPIFLKSFNKKSNKSIIKIGISVYYIALTSYAIFYKGGGSAVPYDTIFGKGLL